MINVLDPYDQQMVTATLASADITLSRTLRAEENLLVGFTPPSSGEISYETKREVLTGGGSWQRPDGVTTVTYILISGAQGGYAGNSGARAGTMIISSTPLVGVPSSDTGTVKQGPEATAGSQARAGESSRVS